MGQNIFGADTHTPNELSFVEVMKQYLLYYSSVSSHTARAKQADLNHFLRFLVQQGAARDVAAITLSAWNASAVEAFLESRLQRGESPATVARRLATLKHFGRTLAERLPGVINPAREVRPPKQTPLRPHGISAAEREAILERARNRLAEKPSFGRLRNLTIFEVMVHTGLRADEVRLLRRHQLDYEAGWLRNVRTKGRRYRNVYLPSNLRPTIDRYLAARAAELSSYSTPCSHSVDASLPLFISGYRATLEDPESFLLGSKTLWRAIRELSAETKLHPHLLRHSFAVDLLDDSGDIRLVSQALGHSDVRTTMRYTEREEEHLAARIEDMHRKDRKSK